MGQLKRYNDLLCHLGAVIFISVHAYVRVSCILGRAQHV